MNIVVCVKTNPDLEMVRIKNREPVLDAVPYKVGDLERNALEAAVQLRDEGGEGKVTILAAAEGDRKIKETLKEALAMGADEAVIIADPALQESDQAGIATALAAALTKMGAVDLVLFGEGSSDNYTGQVGPRVAEKLGWPQIGFARSVSVSDGDIRVERSMEDEIEVFEAPASLVVTVVSEINEPRIPSLMNIMKAGKKPVEEWGLEDLGLSSADLGAEKKIISNLAEEQDRKNIILEGDVAEQADQLINALTKEGVLGR